MVKQIKIDENNVVICCSVGGFIEGGFDVEEIPDEVMACPSKWCYVDGEFVENPDYIEPVIPDTPTIDDLIKENEMIKKQIEAQSEQMDFYEDCIAEMASVIYA